MTIENIFERVILVTISSYCNEIQCPLLDTYCAFCGLHTVLTEKWRSMGRTLHRQSMLRPYGRYRQKAAEHRISS